MAETLVAVHTHTHTHGNLIDEKISSIIYALFGLHARDG